MTAVGVEQALGSALRGEGVPDQLPAVEALLEGARRYGVPTRLHQRLAEQGELDEWPDGLTEALADQQSPGLCMLFRFRGAPGSWLRRGGSAPTGRSYRHRSATRKPASGKGGAVTRSSPA